MNFTQRAIEVVSHLIFISKPLETNVIELALLFKYHRREILEIEFISEQYSLYHLEHFFCYLMDGIELDCQSKHRIRLCFQEAVTNAITHANHFDNNKKVYIEVSPTPNNLILKIRDEGEGFDMNEILNPTQDENIFKLGGRGIFLIKEYTESCSYSKENKTLTMVFRR